MNELTKVALQNASLLAGVGVMLWWLFPKLFLLTLNNGGGKAVRSIIQEENIHQSTVTHLAIADHEAREFREYGSLKEAVTLVREKLATIDARLGDHLADARAAR